MHKWPHHSHRKTRHFFVYYEKKPIIVIIVKDDEVKHFSVSQGIAQQIVKLCDTPVYNKRGRPKATSKSLADYVCSGVDADALKEEMEQRLTKMQCTARDIALLEKTLMDEGKIMGPIPYKVLKMEFGELVTCAGSSLNWCERQLRLRRQQ